MASASAEASSLRHKHVLRRLRLLVHLVEGLITCALLLRWIKPHTKWALTQRWSHKLLILFHVPPVVHGEPIAGPELAGSILVSNYMSWIDIYAINSWYPLRLVTKSEIRSRPVIGWLCVQIGMLLVERARKRGVHRIIHVITDAMRSSNAIRMFPGGTTSDGLQLLPFHANLFQTPVSAGTPIHPLALRYRTTATGELTTILIHIGDLPMMDTTSAMLNRPPLVVEVSVGPAVAPEVNRRALAAHSQETVASLTARAD